jgi:hypothetical protein
MYVRTALPCARTFILAIVLQAGLTDRLVAGCTSGHHAPYQLGREETGRPGRGGGGSGSDWYVALAQSAGRLIRR